MPDLDGCLDDHSIEITDTNLITPLCKQCLWYLAGVLPQPMYKWQVKLHSQQNSRILSLFKILKISNLYNVKHISRILNITWILQVNVLLIDSIRQHV